MLEHANADQINAMSEMVLNLLRNNTGSPDLHG